MKRGGSLLIVLLICLPVVGYSVSALSATTQPVRTQPGSSVPARKAVPDSRQLEKDLQSLNWRQFKAVVEAIPPIKAEVDRYGPLGWQYVQQHYKTYPWKKPIDRLENWQKQELARLIERARKVS